ncbi:MAG: CHASE2 domain-containing protein, partial [Thermodesulfobacteriota bacterium]
MFELKAFDSLSKYLNPAGSSDSIVIVQVDQESIDALSKEGVNWPWPRQIYAPIIEYLSEADAIFVDILFTEASSYGEEDDMVLADAVKRSSNVYLPVFLSKKTVKMSTGEEEFIRSIAIRENISSNLKFNSAITPIDPLKKSVRGGGNVMIKPDVDGVYRKVPLVFKLEQYQVPHFVLDYLIDSGKIKIVQNRLSVEGSEIPLNNGELLLRYYRNEDSFEIFSASEILKSYLNVNSSKPPPIKKNFFKGKVVFLGLTAAGLYDLKPTSISSISTGVFIHATTLDNILNKSFIRIVNPYLEILFMLLISFFITFTVLKRHSLLINLSLFLVTLSIILLVTILLFKIAIYVKVIPTVISLILSFMIVVAYSYATEGRERVLLRKTFSQYMDKKIADYLLENPALIKPGGQRKRVTVFFADIAGFTT